MQFTGNVVGMFYRVFLVGDQKSKVLLLSCLCIGVLEQQKDMLVWPEGLRV